jgi:hypothetical protein
MRRMKAVQNKTKRKEDVKEERDSDFNEESEGKEGVQSNVHLSLSIQFASM